jgi:hypothetical protein
MTRIGMLKIRVIRVYPRRILLRDKAIEIEATSAVVWLRRTMAAGRSLLMVVPSARRGLYRRYRCHCSPQLGTAIAPRANPLSPLGTPPSRTLFNRWQVLPPFPVWRDLKRMLWLVCSSREVLNMLKPKIVLAVLAFVARLEPRCERRLIGKNFGRFEIELDLALRGVGAVAGMD